MTIFRSKQPTDGEVLASLILAPLITVGFGYGIYLAIFEGYIKSRGLIVTPAAEPVRFWIFVALLIGASLFALYRFVWAINYVRKH